MPSLDRARPEFTPHAVILGLILSVVMGAANVYLGLKAGMTVSASIPAAVVATALLRGLLRRDSLLEANLVQTAASAGESLSAGIIFTVPALILVGVWTDFHYWTTTFIAMGGGLLGVLLMIPLRRALIVEDRRLMFPEGVACAEVLRAGDMDPSASGGGGSGIRYVVGGTLVGGLMKLIISFFGLLRESIALSLRPLGRPLAVGMDVSPALIAVGCIVGLPVALQIFLGGAIGHLAAIPLLAGNPPAEGVSTADWAELIWKNQARYMGVGAMIVGGIVSIWGVRAGIRSALGEIFSAFRKRGPREFPPPTERNISGRSILLLMIACLLLIGAVYYHLLQRHLGIAILCTGVMFVLAFFLTAVASYIVGLVGNSNSPVSGMTITGVLATGAIVWLFGYQGVEAIVATLGVAGVVCCVACTSGDVCNDLKTGHLVGASPRYQQILQILGVIVGALILAPVMTILHEGSIREGTGGIGGQTLPAPQAMLFASLADGFFGKGDLPEKMVFWGVGIGVTLVVLDQLLVRAGSKHRLHVMPVAVGIYLPLGLSTAILLGGLLHWAVGRGQKGESAPPIKRLILLASGAIAGESLMGVALGGLAWLGYGHLEMGEKWLGSAAGSVLPIASAVTIFLLIAAGYRICRGPGRTDS